MDPIKTRMKSSVSASSWPIFHPTNSTEADEISKKIEEKLIKKLNEQANESNHFDMSDISPFITEGIDALVDDEFTKCFTSNEGESWNWNIYLFPMWLFGLFLRYCVVFPLRLTCLMMGTFLFACGFIFASTMMKGDKKLHYQKKLIRFYCSVFVMAWSGVVRYHGVKPPKRKNQIFVANHTTVMDAVILQQHSTYAFIGQKHPGIMGFVQKYLLSCIGCLWFNRSEAKDRLTVARLIKEHIQNEKNSPLLVFPEGVCVNNEYCVMFKKGAFELGAVVHPIAIKYNKLFVDAFYNSKKQTFVRHLFNLLTCWAVVCDVWYLEPQTIRPNESPVQFANRVKALIAKKAGLINVHWDGYLKYFRPSPRFLETKQRVFAQSIARRYRSDAAQQDSSSSSAPNSPNVPKTRQTSPPLSSPLGPASFPRTVSAPAISLELVHENGKKRSDEGGKQNNKKESTDHDHGEEQSVEEETPKAKMNGVHLRKNKSAARAER